jgi:hypothetical protein
MGRHFEPELAQVELKTPRSKSHLFDLRNGQIILVDEFCTSDLKYYGDTRPPHIAKQGVVICRNFSEPGNYSPNLSDK